MAIRFIDTSFHKSPYVRGLKGPLKALYTFIICDCNGAGIWSADFQAASLYTGFEITQREFEENFTKTGKAIELDNGKFFFPDFIEHQYPKGLKKSNPAQINFINELLKYGLIDEDLQVIQRPFTDPSPTLSRVISNGNGKSNGNGQGKATEKKTKNLNLRFPFDSEEFLSAWGSLLTCKKWVGKSELALQASLNKLGKEGEQDAITMINNCIAGNWQGLVELKPHEKFNYNNESAGTKHPSKSTGNDRQTRTESVKNMAEMARKVLRCDQPDDGS